MKVIFTGRPPQLADPDPRQDRSAGVPPIPDHILDRHHARRLRPGEAPIAPGRAAPRGTIYRYDRLLLNQRVIGDPERRSELDHLLAEQGVRLHCPDSPGHNRRGVLSLGDRGTPAALDAWTTVQHLRASVHNGRCREDLANRVGLEHILVGSALDGVGTWRGAPRDDHYPGAGGPFDSALFRGEYPGRVPVDVVLPMPSRRPVEALPGGRRPVLAVLDTGVTPAHPAFDVAEKGDGRDAFVTVDSALQDALAAGADDATPLIEGPWDEPFTDGSLTGRIATHYGHGTFITGIIRQIAPDARVRSIRVMHNDGLVYENELIGALTALADDVERARGGDATVEPVDIVVLAMGYVDEEPDGVPTGGQFTVIERLTRLGVAVVAAAGNYATDRPFYPAAFAGVPREDGAAPILSVGALNPNGTVAMFSNGGSWLSCHASGAAIVSTYPIIPDGASSPRSETWNGAGGVRRETLDPDDYTSGYAIWSGTSFAAPVAAAALAAAMTAVEAPAAFDLTDARAAANRLHDAVKAIGG